MRWKNEENLVPKRIFADRPYLCGICGYWFWREWGFVKVESTFHEGEILSAQSLNVAFSHIAMPDGQVICSACAVKEKLEV